MIFLVFSVSSILTRPSTSLIGAMPLGIRASNSSWIRGRPCVMSSARHTAGVEGTHRQLGTGLADGLRGDDADRLAHVHPLACGQRAAVALGADTDLGLADQDVVRPDLLDAGVDEGRSSSRWCPRRLPRGPCRPTSMSSARLRPVPVFSMLGSLRSVAVGALLGDLHREPTLRAAVLLADDDVLRHVHQAPGEVPGVGGPQRGVGQALAGTVGRDEVLEHGQALAEAGLDRPRDRLALGVRDQATHAGDLPDLHRVTTGTGVDHHPDRVGRRERGLHVLGDIGWSRASRSR